MCDQCELGKSRLKAVAMSGNTIPKDGVDKDCAIVALSLVTGENYWNVLDVLLAYGFDPSRGMPPEAFENAVRERYWDVFGPDGVLRVPQGTVVTAAELVKRFPDFTGIALVNDLRSNPEGHAFPIVNGEPVNADHYHVHDTPLLELAVSRNWGDRNG